MYAEEDICSIVESVIREAPFSERDKEYASRKELVFQQRAVKIPGIKDLNMQYRSPEIEDDGHAFKNRMLAAPVKINVAARTKSEGALQKAQNLENFFYRLYHRWREKGVFDGPLFDQATLGIGWFHISLNTDIIPLIPDYEDQDPDEYLKGASEELEKFSSGEKPDLFPLTGVQPETVYWTPDKRMLIQAAVIPLSQIADMYGKRGKKISLDEDDNLTITTLGPGESYTTPVSHWSKTVTLYTVETDEYCYHVIMEGKGKKAKQLAVYKNYFGTPGFVPVPGEITGNPHPLYAYRPLVNGKYQTVPLKNVAVTTFYSLVTENAQQRYQLKWIGEGAPPEDETNIQVQVTDDGILVPPPGYEMVNTNLQVGFDVPRAIETIEALDKYGYPKSLNRPEEVQAQSGYDRARQQDAVASLLNPPLDHFASALTQIFKAVAHAVKEIDLPLTVRNIKPLPGEKMGSTAREVTIKPDDIIEADISVSFNSITIFSRIAMQEEGLKMMQADQMTETDFQSEIVGTDDVEAWREQRALDKVLKASDDRAVRDALAAIDAIAASTTELAMAQNGVSPATPPVPTMPNMVETNGQQLRSDRGASIPIGPGAAMPVSPTPPNAAELGMP